MKSPEIEIWSDDGRLWYVIRRYRKDEDGGGSVTILLYSEADAHNLGGWLRKHMHIPREELYDRARRWMAEHLDTIAAASNSEKGQ